MFGNIVAFNRGMRQMALEHKSATQLTIVEQHPEDARVASNANFMSGSVKWVVDRARSLDQLAQSASNGSS